MIHAWGLTDKGVVRRQNQDSFYLDVPSEQAAVGVVCDGMGGARAGNIASSLAVEAFADALRGLLAQEDAGRSPGELMAQSAETANRTVYQRACGDPACRGMGTTLVAVLVREQTASILNIGDSRCYHVGEGGIRRVTRDHSVVEDMVARGDITPEEARTHPRKNLITRALGSEPKVQPDLYEQALLPGEFLLLCSDGLSNLLTDQEIHAEILRGGTPENCCKRLLDIAISRGAPDNVTVVLMEIQ